MLGCSVKNSALLASFKTSISVDPTKNSTNVGAEDNTFLPLLSGAGALLDSGALAGASRHHSLSLIRGVATAVWRYAPAYSTGAARDDADGTSLAYRQQSARSPSHERRRDTKQFVAWNDTLMGMACSLLRDT